ncbi:C39 family peptidase [Mariniluteicoccus flavus]
MTLTRRTFLAGAGATAAATLGGAALLGPDKAHAANWKVLKHDYQAQETGNWCGAAATRIAISCRKPAPSQAQLARELRIDNIVGTAHIGLVTNVLNQHFGGYYESKLMPNDPPTPAQRDLLWHDIVYDIDRGYGLVANIVAPPGNQPPGYPANETVFHYIAIVGYNPDLKQAYIADSANFGGNHHYWLSFDQLATLIPPKGYSA